MTKPLSIAVPALRNREALLPFAGTLVTVWDEEFTLEGEYLVSPELGIPCEADVAVLSWNLNFPHPPHGRMCVEVRTEGPRGWTPWTEKFSYDHGHYGSIPKQEDADMQEEKVMKACQVRFRLSSGVRLLSTSFTFLKDQKTKEFTRPAAYSLPGTKLLISGVPKRQQLPENQFKSLYPRTDEKRNNEVGHLICSPVSLSMVLSYYGSDDATCLAVATAAYDPTTGYYGVWGLNIAAVHTFIDGYGAVIKMESMAQLEEQISLGRPVVTSIRWKEGELTGAPIPASGGHLVVVVGFTEDGNVLVHDPRSDDLETVHREYNREEFWHAWQNSATGIVYLVF
jgi:hypothetical protein